MKANTLNDGNIMTSCSECTYKYKRSLDCYDPGRDYVPCGGPIHATIDGVPWQPEDHDVATSCSEPPARVAVQYHDLPISCSEAGAVCIGYSLGICDGCTIQKYCDENTGGISCSLRGEQSRRDRARERLGTLIDGTPEAIDLLYGQIKQEIMDRNARRDRENAKEEGAFTFDSQMSKAYERVEHPRHYNRHPSGVECITIVECMTFNVGTAMKHLWRAGLKPGASALDDLQKAVRYIQFEIGKIERESAK